MLDFHQTVYCVGREYELSLEMLYCDNFLIGFMVTAGPQTEDEEFCTSMQQALTDESAVIEITGDGIIITNPHAPISSGIAMFEIDNHACLAALNNTLIDRDDHKLAFRETSHTLTPGFKIVLAEYADVE